MEAAQQQQQGAPRTAARKRPSSGAAGCGATPLKSPLLSDLWPETQPRKLARTSGPAVPLRAWRKRPAPTDAPQLTGHLGKLPEELLQQVLGYCGPRELGVLEATCSYFIKSGLTDRIAKHFLRDIPRAKGLKPAVSKGESYVTLLNFVTGQSNAAAQGTAIALGTYHTVGLLCADEAAGPEYAMYSCGRGFHGQLGLEHFDNQHVPQRVSAVDRDSKVPLYQGTPEDIHLAVVAAGSSHSASISRRGELYTWGLASSGELGHGGWTPIEVAVPRMISSLQRTRIVSVACGANHSLAISETGQLWSCGRGRHGQLGHGHFHDEGLLQLVETIRHERIVSVAAGRAHSVALAADGKIFSWGDASRGQLGHAQLAAMMQGPNPAPLSIPFPQAIQSLEPARLKPPARVTAIAAGGDHSMAVTVAGTLLAFGCNKHGQLGTGDTLDRLVPTEVPLTLDSETAQLVRAMQVQCGMQHTLALVQVQGSHQVRSVGGNNYGELGLGDRVERHRFHPIPRLNGKQVVCVSVGDWHNAAICQDGQLYVWGRGDCGQLGLGDDKNRWVPKLLPDFTIIHPDRTLRRNRKPVLKAVLLREDAQQPPQPAAPPSDMTPAHYPAAAKQQ
ncbi:E3 ubiquitin-ligase HERC2 [Micractinium conductrix]|uniref:E3 ubiquitin-ligase HERC2 n=1 Tax=Micractinium conductrix TaxID=554055 RepID=A0A2P6V6Y0_9CHLO|nr:E3 ubiquitin-ligase HERC2 [Micractinium conductrix]|eukprot:PSC69842.1 E3 ubiquitin-ligase HERC2 [Micractinium conductrix]